PGSDHPLFPTCDGQRWHSCPHPDSREEAKGRFLEAYFQINLAYARLVALRERHGAKVPRAHERKVFIAIERTNVARENLQDRYASQGEYGTPRYRDGFTTGLRLTDRKSRRPNGDPVMLSSASVRITIPVPPGFHAKSCKD